RSHPPCESETFQCSGADSAPSKPTERPAFNIVRIPARQSRPDDDRERQILPPGRKKAVRIGGFNPIRFYNSLAVIIIFSPATWPGPCCLPQRLYQQEVGCA